MLKIFIFIIISYGITNIVTYSSLFEGLRNYFNKINPNYLGKLFSCPLCFSTWVGFLLSFIFQYYFINLITPSTYYGINNLYLSIFLDGCFISGTTWIIYNIVDYLIESTNFNYNNNKKIEKDLM